jgi:hypothetical protein
MPFIVPSVSAKRKTLGLGAVHTTDWTASALLLPPRKAASKFGRIATSVGHDGIVLDGPKKSDRVLEKNFALAQGVSVCTEFRFVVNKLVEAAPWAVKQSPPL